LFLKNLGAPRGEDSVGPEGFSPPFGTAPGLRTRIAPLEEDVDDSAPTDPPYGRVYVGSRGGGATQGSQPPRACFRTGLNGSTAVWRTVGSPGSVGRAVGSPAGAGGSGGRVGRAGGSPARAGFF
jgi:hypothetical protein